MLHPICISAHHNVHFLHKICMCLCVYVCMYVCVCGGGGGVVIASNRGRKCDTLLSDRRRFENGDGPHPES